MRLIGITGSIACGKTTVSSELIRKGYPVIDGDLLSRELTGPGGPAMAEIRSVFGDRFVRQNGSLDRQEMGRLVFSDPQARARLDRIMAPYLRRLTLQRIESARASGASLCFLDFPLLYEKGYDQYCDTVWCIWIPEDLQLQRLMARDGCTQEDALSRMRAVLSSDEKADRSPVVIDNSGPVDDTLQQVEDQLNIELARTAAASRRRRTGSTGSMDQPLPVPAAVPSPAAESVPFTGIERSESTRRKPSARKSSWVMPVRLKQVLAGLAVILAVSFTAQMLMNAYLAQRREQHEEEQNNINTKYPEPGYKDEIIEIAAEYNLSPALIAAVILNESSFNPKAVSPVGARGLMQLMPDTAEWIAQKMRLDNYSFEQMEDPETNIRFGCWYLNFLSNRFGGDPLCVICAYHAGQGEISSWLSNPLYSSDGKTLNQASLPEGPTKIYAGRVTRDYGIYKAKYFDSDLHADSADGSAVSD